MQQISNDNGSSSRLAGSCSARPASGSGAPMMKSVSFVPHRVGMNRVLDDQAALARLRSSRAIAA
jgi:hypothetical protein